MDVLIDERLEHRTEPAFPIKEPRLAGLFNLTFSNLIYHFIRLLHTFTHVCTVNIYICNCTEIIIIKFLEAS